MLPLAKLYDPHFSSQKLDRVSKRIQKAFGHHNLRLLTPTSLKTFFQGTPIINPTLKPTTPRTSLMGPSAAPMPIKEAVALSSWNTIIEWKKFQQEI